MDDEYGVGRNLGAFVRGIVDGIADNSTGSEDGIYNDRKADAYVADLPPLDTVVGMFNQAATINPGSLLVTCQRDNSCFQVDLETKEFEFLFQLRHEREPFLWRVICDPTGAILCTLGGTKITHGPFKYASMDLWGAIVELDTRSAHIHTIAEGNHLQMPAGIEFLEFGELLVCGASDFPSPGVVYTVDRASGKVRKIAQGGRLKDPVTAVRLEDGTILVANSDQERQDGELIAILPDGDVRVIVPFAGDGGGSLTGVCKTRDPRQVVTFRMDWPLMRSSAISLVDLSSGKEERLFSSSPLKPQFYSTCGVVTDENVLWFGESYEKQLVGYSIDSGREVDRISCVPILGMGRGMINSYASIENLYVVPGA